MSYILGLEGGKKKGPRQFDIEKRVWSEKRQKNWRRQQHDGGMEGHRTWNMRLWVCNRSLGFRSLHVVYMFACSRLFSLSLSLVSPIVISPTNRNQGRNFTKNISSSVHMI